MTAPRPRLRPARPGVRTVIVSKKFAVTTSTPPARKPRRERGREPVDARGDRAEPFGPWYDAYSPAITASSTCAVQMLLVAFSRRMCCSRVCSASRYAVRPGAVDRHADEPAGQRALVFVARREERGVRAAEAERHAEPLRRADDDVGADLARAASPA